MIKRLLFWITSLCLLTACGCQQTTGLEETLPNAQSTSSESSQAAVESASADENENQEASPADHQETPSSDEKSEDEKTGSNLDKEHLDVPDGWKHVEYGIRIIAETGQFSVETGDHLHMTMLIPDWMQIEAAYPTYTEWQDLKNEKGYYIGGVSRATAFRDEDDLIKSMCENGFSIDEVKKVDGIDKDAYLTIDFQDWKGKQSYYYGYRVVIDDYIVPIGFDVCINENFDQVLQESIQMHKQIISSMEIVARKPTSSKEYFDSEYSN